MPLGTKSVSLSRFRVYVKSCALEASFTVAGISTVKEGTTASVFSSTTFCCTLAEGELTFTSTAIAEMEVKAVAATTKPETARVLNLFRFMGCTSFMYLHGLILSI